MELSQLLGVSPAVGNIGLDRGGCWSDWHRFRLSARLSWFRWPVGIATDCACGCESTAATTAACCDLGT